MILLSLHNLCDQHVRSKMQIEGAIMLAHAFPQEVLDHPLLLELQLVNLEKEVKVTLNINALFGQEKLKITLSG
jgi:hypothetical protein